MQTVDKNKYELRNTEPDEIVAATPTYIFLSKWSLPLFILTLTFILLILFNIKIPSSLTEKIILTHTGLSSAATVKFYGKMPVPENLLPSIVVTTPVTVEFYNLGDSKKYILKGSVDTIFVDPNSLQFYAGVLVSKEIPEAVSVNPPQRMPANATIIFSNKSIFGHLFQ